MVNYCPNPLRHSIQWIKYSEDTTFVATLRSDPPLLFVAFTLYKLDSRETPPPLHYSPTLSDVDRVSPHETTPVSTPGAYGLSSVYPRKAEREKDLRYSWHHRASPAFGGPSSLYLDSTLLDPDFEDSTFPLFEQRPSDVMAANSSAIGIAMQHNNNSAPRQQTSNLTSALQSNSGLGQRPLHESNNPNNTTKSGATGRHDSISMAGLTPQYGSGAQPISVGGPGRSQPRRESGAGSMMGGMSWGGVSMNSWVRDE